MGRLKVETDGQAPENVKRLIRIAAKSAYAYFGYPFDAEMSVLFTDDAGIRRINAEHRGIDSATDVLSFPLCDFVRGECKTPESETDLDTGRLPIGDMVLSLEHAKAQAEEYGHGLARECAYLTVHSVLHLLGFDHTDEGPEKATMREKEEEILKRLGLERK